MGRLNGKVAIVTGGAGGIGAAISQLFACEGARVVTTDIDDERGEDVSAVIRKRGGQALFIRQDVTVESDWAAVMQKAERAFGAPQVIVNNAAVAFPNGSVEKQTLDEWRGVIRANMDSVFLGVKHGIAAIRHSNAGGSIINISSILGMVGSATTAAYTASKGGVRLLTKSAALHCAKAGYNIRVNSVVPGWIQTSMMEESLRRLGSYDSERERICSLIPLGRAGTPNDIACGALYLASDESKYVTGTDLVIDGGYLTQ